MYTPTREFVRLGELRPHTVVCLQDGTLARTADSYVEGGVELITLTGSVMPSNAATLVEVLAHPEQTAEAFMVSLQPQPDVAGGPTEFCPVMAWSVRRAASPDEVVV